MIASAEKFASNAETLAGTPYRLNGRNPDIGLDCIGLVVAALDQSGISATPPVAYSLRNREIERYLPFAETSGFSVVEGEIKRGDLLLVTPGPAQFHALIALGENRFVHAHAGLRRTVIQRGLSGWAVRHHWRLSVS